MTEYIDKMKIRKFYQENMYGTWRSGEKVTYELLGEDPKAKEKQTGFRNPFEVIGGELVKIMVEANGKRSEFIVHVFIPKAKNSEDVSTTDTVNTENGTDIYKNGHPFIICMHPIQPLNYALEHGYALFFMEIGKIASDDINHNGVFYDLYPYGAEPGSQTGALMAWAWGVSKVLDAVYNGLGKEFGLDPDASMVTGVSRYGKATAVCGAFDDRFRMTIPACSGAGGLALYNFISTGKTYDLRKVGASAEYTYGKNEPLDCLQSDAERGWFNDAFLKYKMPSDIPMDQENLVTLAMSPDRYYFIVAACTGEDWVNAPAMWECYKLADEKYTENNLADHLVLNFHKVGHAVLEEDMERIIKYFNHMYYKEGEVDIASMKTTVFAGQEAGDAPMLKLRPYKSCDSEKIASWLMDEEVYDMWGGERFGSFPVSAETINRKYTEQNGDCTEPDNFYPMIAYDESGVVGHFIMRYLNGDKRCIRFGWIVVDDSKRGLGYGKRMLELGLKYAFEILKARIVNLGVCECNTAAYNCYKSVGFKEAECISTHNMTVKGRDVRVIELEMSAPSL